MAATSAADPRALVKWLIRLVILLGVIWGIYGFVSGASSDLGKQEVSWRQLKPAQGTTIEVQ